MKESMILHHELPGAQMPPDIRVDHAAPCHGEQTQSQHPNENVASLEKAGHVSFRGKWNRTVL